LKFKKNIVSLVLVLSLIYSLFTGIGMAYSEDHSGLDINENISVNDESSNSDGELLDDGNYSPVVDNTLPPTEEDLLNSGTDDNYDGNYEVKEVLYGYGELDLIEQFVARLYTLVLNRDYDLEGLQMWSDLLRSRRETGGHVAYGFFFSQEFLNRGADNGIFVDILYRTLLNREPDAQGRSEWLALLNAGLPRQDVFEGFVNSVEFGVLCEQAGIERGTYVPPPGGMIRVFVTRLYTTVLQRSPDQVGLDNWTEALLRGRNTGAEAAYGFVFSSELIDRDLSDQQFLKVLYNALLGRDPDSEGMANWLYRLETDYSRYCVFVGFVMSQEFYQICNNHGIIRGTLPQSPHNPRPQVNRVVVLDAGHGTVGSPGWNGYSEAVAMLDLARRLRPLLEAEGITVKMTRNNEINIPLPDRCAMINIWALEMVRDTRRNPTEIAEINRLIGVMESIIGNPARAHELMNVNPFYAARTIHPELRRVFEITSDSVIRENFLVISLHSNATTAPVNTAIRGSEAYFIDPSAHANTRAYFTGFAFTNESREFGNIILNQIAIAGIPRRAGGLRAANYAIIREINVPAVLVENGFHTNAEDRALLSNPAWRQTLATHYVTAILQYFSAR